MGRKMSAKIDLVAKELYSDPENAPGNIKFFFEGSQTTADGVADYLMRVRAQVRNGAPGIECPEGL